MKNLLNRILNHFGYYKKDEMITQVHPSFNLNTLRVEKTPRITTLRSVIRPSYEEMMQLPLNPRETLKSELIRKCKYRLFDEAEKHIILEEITDSSGPMIITKLNVVNYEQAI